MIMIMIIEIISPLFTLGSICSTNASGAQQIQLYLKQIILIKLNRVNNPNWLETIQLAMYEHGRGFELWSTMDKFSK